MDRTAERRGDGRPTQTFQSLSSLFNLTSLGGEARSQLSRSLDPSNIMSLISTTSTSSVSLTTEDSASNTTVVNIANMSKKRPLSSPDASYPRRSQCKKYWIYHAPLDETLGHQCVRIRHQPTSVIILPVLVFYHQVCKKIEAYHDQTNKMVYQVSSPNQPGYHPSLLRVRGAPIDQLGKRRTKGSRLNSHLGHAVVFLSKILHPNCFVLVKPRKLSKNDQKIVDLDVKPQTIKEV